MLEGSTFDNDHNFNDNNPKKYAQGYLKRKQSSVSVSTD